MSAYHNDGYWPTSKRVVVPCQRLLAPPAWLPFCVSGAEYRQKHWDDVTQGNFGRDDRKIRNGLHAVEFISRLTIEDWSRLRNGSVTANILQGSKIMVIGDESTEEH